MRIRRAAAALFGLTLAWTAALGAQTPAELDALAEQWEAAFDAGDMVSIVTLYTVDAERAPPGADLLVGPDAILADLGTYADLEIDITATGGMLGDEVGVTWGDYLILDEGAMVDEGRWMNAVMLTEDGWRIRRDIWNSTVPPPEGCM